MQHVTAITPLANRDEEFDWEECARTLARIFWAAPPSLPLKLLRKLTPEEFQYMQWMLCQQPGYPHPTPA